MFDEDSKTRATAEFFHLIVETGSGKGTPEEKFWGWFVKFVEMGSGIGFDEDLKLA